MIYVSLLRHDPENTLNANGYLLHPVQHLGNTFNKKMKQVAPEEAKP
jgi:hypothetical protein